MSGERAGGGMAAREAVLRWSLRMFRREWRQQILICLLVAAAVATTILAAGFISGSQEPQNAGYGSANTLATLSGQDPHLDQELAALRGHFGQLGLIESSPISTGTVSGALLESLDPHGAYTGPIVQLASGRFPTGRDEVDLTSALAALYGTHVGGTWVAVGTRWHVVGEVRTPTDLNATLALAAPGAIAHPAAVTALFDSTPASLASFSPPKAFYDTLVSSIALEPTSSGIQIGELLVLIAATFGMLFIGLIAVAGFTVLARRRTRAIGMLGALGAEESVMRLGLVINGLVVGLASMVLGGIVGLVGWWLYAPHLQASVGHVVDPAGIPWWLVGVALLLAPVTTTLAARRPARSDRTAPDRHGALGPADRADGVAPQRRARGLDPRRRHPPRVRRRRGGPRRRRKRQRWGRARRAPRDRRGVPRAIPRRPSGSSLSSATSRGARPWPPRSPCATLRAIARDRGPRSARSASRCS